MKSKLNQCPHIDSHHVGALVDVQKLQKQVKSCASCDYAGPNLWICLQINCLRVGCSEQANDHSTQHFEQNKAHCVHMNLSSQRAWCYLCESEVFLPQLHYASLASDAFLNASSASYEYNGNGRGSNENEQLEDPKGLVGLQNLANTCYMNSALQALSNVQPITQYFLDCADLVDHTVSQLSSRSCAGLAKSYQQLIKEIWGENAARQDSIAPRGILYGIRIVHPMFRGFHQHDTQEFLRCFMDQLHEELKEQSNSASLLDVEQDDDSSSTFSCPSPRGLQSANESDYDTCDSFDSNNALLNESKNDCGASKRTLSNNTNASEKQTITATTHNNTDRSIITDVFDGKLLSSVQCLTCDRISTREETFQDLSLPIPNRDFLNILHQSHSASAQSLSSIDSNMSSNEGWIAWFWNILRLWLWGPSVTLYDCMASFFSADELKGDNMYSCEKCQKLRTGVKYSRILNLPEVLCIHLKRFRHDLSCSSKINASVQFPLENLDMTPYLHKNHAGQIAHYNLVSVICHHGTVGGGHYTSFARNAFTNRWYEYDDQHVIETSAEVVQRCQAYVLFYRKHNPQMDMIRSKARDISISNPVHLSDIRFYISKEWLVRFNTFAEPGPINNCAMLCPHGGILQSKVPLLSQIAIPIAQPLWDFLYERFGGGPVVNLLFECEICKQAADALKRRQLYELNVFTKYNDAYTDLEASAIFAISMPWLRAWQQFAKGLSNREPGPINNKDIAATAEDGSLLMRKVRAGSDYAQICAPLWRFLHFIYGGGPAIVLRRSQANEQFVIIDQDDELDLRHQSHVQANAACSSDTESNIGATQQRNEISTEFLDFHNHEIETSAAASANNSCSEVASEEDSARNTLNSHELEKHMQQSSSSSKDAKRIKHATAAYRKSATKPIIFKGGRRNKEKSNYRLTSKHGGDIFGATGTFNKLSEAPMDNEVSDEVHVSEQSSHVNAKTIPNGLDKYRKHNTAFHHKKHHRRQHKHKAQEDSTTTLTAASVARKQQQQHQSEERILFTRNEYASESMESDA